MTNKDEVKKRGRPPSTPEMGIRPKVTCEYIYHVLKLDTLDTTNFLGRFPSTKLSYDIFRSYDEGREISKATLYSIQVAFNKQFKEEIKTEKKQSSGKTISEQTVKKPIPNIANFYHHGPHRIFDILYEKDPFLASAILFRQFGRITELEVLDFYLGMTSDVTDSFTVMDDWKTANLDYKKKRLSFEEHQERLTTLFKQFNQKRLRAEKIIGFGALIYKNREAFARSRYIELFALVASIVENNFFLSPVSLNAIGDEALEFCRLKYRIEPHRWPIKYQLGSFQVPTK